MMDPISQVVSAIFFMYIDFLYKISEFWCIVIKVRKGFYSKILISIQVRDHTMFLSQTICIGFSDVIV
jgi:hypothetical protein